MELTSKLLQDFCSHQAWADAESWNAFDAFPASLNDEALWKRLHHIHMVQWAFLWIVRGNPLDRSKAKDFETPEALKAWAIMYHREMKAWLDSATPEMLAETVLIPWFKTLEIQRSQAILQATMHSHYHRGQNATRLRELGGEPASTDFIVWIWKGQPDPSWVRPA